jgi:hypothetical protein
LLGEGSSACLEPAAGSLSPALDSGAAVVAFGTVFSGALVDSDCGSAVTGESVLVSVRAVVALVAAVSGCSELTLLARLSGLESSPVATLGESARPLGSETDADLPRLRGSLVALGAGSAGVVEGCSTAFCCPAALCAGTVSAVVSAVAFPEALDLSAGLATGAVRFWSCSIADRSLRGRRLLFARSSLEG